MTTQSSKSVMTFATPSHTHTTSANFARTHKRNWPTATKSAFYANFYAVDEATGATIE